MRTPPPELLRQVADSCSVSDIHSMSLVNKDWYYLFVRALYTRVHLRSPVKLWKFSRAIFSKDMFDKRPRLRRYPRALCIEYYSWSCMRSSVVIRLLCKLTRLEDLDLRISDDYLFEIFRSEKLLNAAFRLKRFACPLCPHQMYRFLSQQNEIECFTHTDYSLQSMKVVQTLPKQYLPRLRSLRAPTATLVALVPDRAISSIRVLTMPGLAGVDNVLSAVTQASLPLTNLVIELCSDSIFDLPADILALLPKLYRFKNSLDELGLELTWRFLPMTPPSKKVLILSLNSEALIAAFRPFNKLRSPRLTARKGNPKVLQFQFNGPDMLYSDGWKQACPSLNCVSIFGFQFRVS